MSIVYCMLRSVPKSAVDHKLRRATLACWRRIPQSDQTTGMSNKCDNPMMKLETSC